MTRNYGVYLMGNKRIKVAFVVQRSGKEVAGGSEAYCSIIAQKMVRYWDVEILTTCAMDYVTWENYYSEATDIIENVPVRRFKVDYPRDIKKFNKYSHYITSSINNISLKESEKWMRLQGPMSSDLLKYIETNKQKYDVFIFFTYLYATTYYGLQLVSEKSYLVPTAHDEFAIYLPIWDEWFKKPQALICSTEEEKLFLEKRFPAIEYKGDIIGIGVSIPESISEVRFRYKHDMHCPFIIYIGRIDKSKGCGELFDFFLRYKTETSNNLKLVLAGYSVMDIPKHDDIIKLGFIDNKTKFDAIKGCEFLVNPSSYESLSIVLLEAWSLNKPVLVSAKCDVMVGQCRRSNGGLWYNNYDEFIACMEYIINNKNIALNGKKFVENNYNWEVITSKYRKLIEKN